MTRLSVVIGLKKNFHHSKGKQEKTKHSFFNYSCWLFRFIQLIFLKNLSYQTKFYLQTYFTKKVNRWPESAEMKRVFFRCSPRDCINCAVFVVLTVEIKALETQIHRMIIAHRAHRYIKKLKCKRRKTERTMKTLFKAFLYRDYRFLARYNFSSAFFIKTCRCNLLVKVITFMY